MHNCGRGSTTPAAAGRPPLYTDSNDLTNLPFFAGGKTWYNAGQLKSENKALALASAQEERAGSPEAHDLAAGKN